MHGSFQGLEQRAVTRAARSGEAGDERREDRHDDVHHALQGFLRRFFHKRTPRPSDPLLTPPAGGGWNALRRKTHPPAPPCEGGE